MHRAPLMPNRLMAVSRKSKYMFELGAELTTCIDHYFYLKKWLTDFKPWWFWLGIQQLLSRQWRVCHFKENKWQYRLPMIKFNLSSKNQNFRKLVSATVSFKIFQFSDKIAGDISEYHLFILYNEIWKHFGSCNSVNRYFSND